jgi:hypothetical protein
MHYKRQPNRVSKLPDSLPNQVTPSPLILKRPLSPLRAIAAPSVAPYTLSRLSQLGLDRIYGVPGDDAFSIDDAAELVPGHAQRTDPEAGADHPPQPG